MAFIDEIITKYEDKMKNLQEKIEASENIEELRSYEKELKEVKETLERAKQETKEGETFTPMATYTSEAKEMTTDDTNTKEYRQKFMETVTKRYEGTVKTADIPAVIPTVLVEKIVEKMEQVGMILPLVTKTYIQAGIVVPVSSIKMTAQWIGEGVAKTSHNNSGGITKITFTNNKLRCDAFVSIEVHTMSLDAFERIFIEQVSVAMTRAIEISILKGTGSGQPEGIIKSGLADNEVTLKGKEPTFKELVEIEGRIPVEYEATAKWFMTKKDFAKFLGMVDANGQPIARVNYGISGKPERAILGRDVVLIPYATEMTGYIAGIYDFKDYTLNTVYDLGISQTTDWDTDDIKIKAVMNVDGKPISRDSLILIKTA